MKKYLLSALIAFSFLLSIPALYTSFSSQAQETSARAPLPPVNP